jgi:hypothetical protein
MTFVLALCAVAAAGISPFSCGEFVRVRAPLERSAIESRASGWILLQMNGQRSVLRLRVRNLDPESEYLLLADDLERARLTTDASGNGTLLLRHPPPAGGHALDFDPRGKRISVSDGSQDRLSAVVSGPLEPRRIQVMEYAGIPPSDPGAGGRAQASYRTVPMWTRIFSVALEDVASGDYQILVDGDPVGEVEADARGSATIRFCASSHPRRRCPGPWRGLGPPGSPSRVWETLDFEPRGAQVEVVRDGEVAFAGPMRARVALPQEAHCPEMDIQVDLIPAFGFGSGDAAFTSEDGGCDHEFRVAARNLPAAPYELWVADTIVGTLWVRSLVGGLMGELRFDTHPDEPDELPLDFDPRGQPIEVRRPISIPSTLYLHGLLPDE